MVTWRARYLDTLMVASYRSLMISMHGILGIYPDCINVSFMHLLPSLLLVAVWISYIILVITHWKAVRALLALIVFWEIVLNLLRCTCPEILNIPSDGLDWYFFCPSPYLAQNSERVKRQTRSGKWKITSQKDEIKARDTKALIGTKRILVFYKGRAKTGWVMHEYHLNPKLLNGYSSTFQVPHLIYLRFLLYFSFAK